MIAVFLNGYLTSWVAHSLLPTQSHCLILRTNLDSPSYLVYLQLQKPRKNFANGLVLSGRPNVCIYFWLNQRPLQLTYLDGRFWEFTSDLAKGDTAYTTLALGAHTDNTYFVRLFDQSKKREVIGFWFDLSRLIPAAYNSFTSFHTRTDLVVLHFLLMVFTLPPFLRSCIRNYTIYSAAYLFLLTQLVNRLLFIVHLHLRVTLFWVMTLSQGK